jgi:hypothetical protein
MSKTDPVEISARYLAGELSDLEAASFEARVAQEPELYRDIELRLQLREGLAVLQAKGELEPLLGSRRRTVRIGLAIAASIIALLIGIVWFFRMSTHAEIVILASSAAELLDANSKPLPIAARYVLVRTRGTEQRNDVPLPPSRSTIELALLPSSMDARARYRISLKMQKSGAPAKPVGEIRGVAADADGYLDIFVDSSHLSPGTYEIASQTEGNELVSASTISFVVPPPR